MCLSDGYRQSRFCKRETEYTVLKKNTVPAGDSAGGLSHGERLAELVMVALQNWIDPSSEKQFQDNKDQFVEHMQHLFARSTQIPASTAPSRQHSRNSSAKVAYSRNWNPTGSKWRPKSGQLPPPWGVVGPMEERADSQMTWWWELGSLKEKCCACKNLCRFKANKIDGPKLL